MMQMRVPDDASEDRLRALREEAARTGRVAAPGARPAGAPFPKASPESGYYGLPALKGPPWTWEVPAYLFVGGAAGAAAVLAAAARGPARRRLARDARRIAAVGGLLAPALLTSDLGKPSRFANMLRVFKPQSPMSVGAWTLAAFSAASLAGAAADWLIGRRGTSRLLRAARRTAGGAAALTGLSMATYTGVLLGATAIPVWSENAALLPAQFGISGLASAAALLEVLGHRDRSLQRLGVLSSAVETLVGVRLESGKGPAFEPTRRGASGALIRAGTLLSGPAPLLLRTVGPLSPRRRRISAALALAGSLLTRVGWIAAGRASAKDPRAALGKS